ncbi:MAG: 2-amino-4-hydroxy-6-hydroxymethyldihydropteridine diphosphokinase, partial [Nitrospinota bacterium]
NVSVEIVRPSDFTIFYISLGSNIEPSRYLQAAIELLSERFTVEACSSQYRSEAWGTTQKQDDYLNMAAKLSSNKDLFSCRAELRWIEQLLARERLIDKFAPRTIDIDILIYNNQLLPDSDTSLGHPVLSHPFIYLPLKEIAPDLIVPNVGTELKDTKPQYIPPIIKCEQVLI